MKESDTAFSTEVELLLEIWVINLKNGHILFLLTAQNCSKTAQIGDFSTSVSEGRNIWKTARKNLQASMSLSFFFEEVFENVERD